MFLRRVSLRMNQNCWRKCDAVLRNPRGNRIFVRLSSERASKSSSFWSSAPALAAICSSESLILTRTCVRWVDLHAARIMNCDERNASTYLSSSRRTVSLAPPSNRTLSGTTIAARPCCFRIVKTWWRKLSYDAGAARTCSWSPTNFKRRHRRRIVASLAAPHNRRDVHASGSSRACRDSERRNATARAR